MSNPTHESFVECRCTGCSSTEWQIESRSRSDYARNVYECDIGISDEEEFERKFSSKSSRKAGKQVRSKYRRNALSKKEAKEKRKSLKPREARRREIRKQAKLDDRNAKREEWNYKWDEMKKENYQSRDILTREEQGGTLYQELLEHNEQNMLSAHDLGIEDEAQYERLMEIALDGDDITPEDFELLLQLDSKNKKSTLEESDVGRFETIVIGQTGKPASKSMSSHCIFCLEVFEKLPDGTELRRLPCQHVFCKSCIDEWLQTNSSKCPNLSCFWKDDKQQEKN